jgi:protein tyrosine phosphatase
MAGRPPPVPVRRGAVPLRRGGGGGGAPLHPSIAASVDETPPSYFAVQQQRGTGPQAPAAAAPMPKAANPMAARQAPSPGGGPGVSSRMRPALRPGAGGPGPGMGMGMGMGPGAGAGAGAGARPKQAPRPQQQQGLGVGGADLVPTYSAHPDYDYVRVARFRDELMHKLQTGGYVQEFDEIEMETANVNLTADFTSALQPYNVTKSRYKNILPLEHTRVVLHEVPGLQGSDFVCANYVSGEVAGSENAYVGSQGPLQATVGDFWRMVWETNTRVVVMVAREVEDGKEKVYPYWPEDVNMPFDVEYLRISLVSAEIGDELVTRRFLLEEIATGNSHTVVQFQYTGWPDQGIPDSTRTFCQLVDLVDDANREAIGKKQGGDNMGALPITVHCSAGIGRTGTFVVFHATLAKLKLLLTQSFDAHFDVKATLLAIRDQRAGMVQTVEQYQFCYQVIVDKLNEVLELLQYKNELWFHKGLESKKAQAMLKRKPHGTFLFRDSSAGGCIVLSAVNGKNVLHARISVDHRGFQIENDFYPSLAKLVNSRSKVFMSPILRTEP